MTRNKIVVFLLSLLFISNAVTAKGFLGKRNVFDYDVLGAPFTSSQSFAYTRIKSNHFALRFGYSRTNIVLPGIKNNVVFQGEMLNYFDPNTSFYDINLSATQNPNFKSNSYSIGFLFSSSYANLNLPVGYFAAYTLYMTKGKGDLHLQVPAEYIRYIMVGHSRDIYGNYSFTQIGSSFDFGKTYYLNPGLLFSIGMQMGAYMRFSKESFNEKFIIYNTYSSPLANFFSNYPYTLPKQIPYSLNLLDDNPGIGLSLMPFLRFGYLF